MARQSRSASKPAPPPFPMQQQVSATVHLTTLGQMLTKRTKAFEDLLPREARAAGGAAQFNRALLLTLSKALDEGGPWIEIVGTQQGRRSVILAALEAASYGLQVNGFLGHAYLVPRRRRRDGPWEAMFMPGYIGKNELAYRTGRVRQIESRSIRECDEFDYSEGSKAFLHYKRPLDADMRSPLIGAYSLARMADGPESFRVLGREEVERKRACSDMWKHMGENSIWGKWPDPMWAKSANHELHKVLPHMVQSQALARIEELREVGEDAPILDASLPEFAGLLLPEATEGQEVPQSQRPSKLTVTVPAAAQEEIEAEASEPRANGRIDILAAGQVWKVLMARADEKKMVNEIILNATLKRVLKAYGVEEVSDIKADDLPKILAELKEIEFDEAGEESK